jgi:hypothetical protein
LGLFAQAGDLAGLLYAESLRAPPGEASEAEEGSSKPKEENPKQNEGKPKEREAKSKNFPSAKRDFSMG